MADIGQLTRYFGDAESKSIHRDWIGMEVETFFLDDAVRPVSLECSQSILRELCRFGWHVADSKSDMVTEVRKGTARIQYELGYPNLELSTPPFESERVVERCRDYLEDLYRAAERSGAHPFFSPVFPYGDFLAIPDERDATWLKLDGRDPLSPLARISAVQFTFNVDPGRAIECLNRLGAARDSFCARYPQDVIWREYIRASGAGYRSDRYGGPRAFASLEHYCEELAKHAVVAGPKLVPFAEADLASIEAISLFVRSIWWYFRLRRYGRSLCIEVRPIPRRRDELLQEQLETVLAIVA
jgi:hypothetical protein